MRIYTYQNKLKKVKSSKHFKRLKSWNWKKIGTWVFRAAALGVLLVAVAFFYYSKDLPDPNKLLSRDVPESTKIFARDGSLLYEIHGEIKRTLVELDQVSPNLQHATIAVEDKNFYNEGGISLTGIARSAVVDIITGKKTQGASTITQQLVKNAILTKDKSWDRKIREAILAVAMDSHFSKDVILKLYLNEIPYGRNAYGIEAASQSYFNKSAKDIDLAQSAYLAAMPQATNYYNPSGPHRDALDARKNTILSLMKDQGYITEAQMKDAQNEKVAFTNAVNAIGAPHFVFWVQDYLANKYGETTLEEGGLKVYTTLDPNLQKIAEDVVKADVAKEEKKYNVHNAALVAIDPKTGQVLAMVGSKDYFGAPEPAGCVGKACLFDPNTNAAISSTLQPGSSFKPYAYVTAFGKDFKYSPASMLVDVTTNFGTYGGKSYIPQNYSFENNGPVSMRKALAGSLNIPAVKTLALVGVDNVTQTAHNLGITTPLQDCGLSLVLGGCTVKLVDHVAAYSVFANGGVKNQETPILKILDKSGKTLEEFKSNPQQTIDPEANYELVNIMTDNAARSFVFGANSPLILKGRTVAAKTGTTQNWHDGWTMGFTPSLVAGVWAGNNNGTLLAKGADGVFVAAPIWHDFMTQALASTTPEDFPTPQGIQKVAVDSISGKLPTDLTPETKTEVFASYAVPTDYDNVHISVPTDAATGLPANSLTPPAQIINQPYKVLHSEKPNDPNWEQPVVAWGVQHGYTYPPDGSTVNTGNGGDTNNGTTQVSILDPEDGQLITSFPFAITVAADSPNKIARVDLSIDGQIFESLSAAPFVFQVNQPLSNGQHSIAAKAIDTNGGTADTSISITVGQASPLSITEPANGTVINSFPTTLTAEGPSLYSTVNFYYQGEKGAAKLLGQNTNINHINNNYQYSIVWQTPVPSGTYQVYAQTDSGIVSKKIKLIIP